MKEDACNKMLACKHPCGGFKDEPKCLPCLDPECIAKGAEENKVEIIGAP